MSSFIIASLDIFPLREASRHLLIIRQPCISPPDDGQRTPFAVLRPHASHVFRTPRLHLIEFLHKTGVCTFMGAMSAMRFYFIGVNKFEMKHTILNN